MSLALAIISLDALLNSIIFKDEFMQYPSNKHITIISCCMDTLLQLQNMLGNWYQLKTEKTFYKYVRGLFYISIQNCSLTQLLIWLHCKEHVLGNSYNL